MNASAKRKRPRRPQFRLPYQADAVAMAEAWDKYQRALERWTRALGQSRREG